MATIVAGCYERFLFGFQAPGGIQKTGDAKEAKTLTKRFTYAAHQNAVKCIASKGPFLASGGGDDQIHLFDLKHDKDLGFLINPGNGPVPCLEFFCPLNASGVPTATPSHMFSGSTDGSIAIWQAGQQWEHLKVMKGHKGAVNALSVHPSGRLALSTAHDGTLRMWDLSKGRCTYTSKLDIEGDDVCFAPGGDTFWLTSGSKVTVHATSGEGGLLGTLQHSRRVLCSIQEHDNVLVTGLEDGAVKVWDLRAGSVQGSIERAHNTRIRGLSCVVSGGPGAGVPKQLASASSDGVVKVWDMRMMSSGVPKGDLSGSTVPSQGSGSIHAALIAQAETKARITCLTTVDPAGQASRAGTATAVALASASRAGATKTTATAGKGEDAPAGKEASDVEAVATTKRMKRAAKKRAKAAREAAEAAAVGKEEELKVAKQRQQVQRPQAPLRPKREEKFEDDFEVIPAASSSDEGDDTGAGGSARGSARGGSSSKTGFEGRGGGRWHGGAGSSRGMERGGKRPRLSDDGAYGGGVGKGQRGREGKQHRGRGLGRERTRIRNGG